MVFFGDLAEFAIEASLEPWPHHVPGGSTNIGGQLRLWFRGHPVGNFDEHDCWLGVPRDHLVEIVERLPGLWHPALAGLTAEQQFDRLDRLNFAAHRHVSIWESLSPSEQDALVAEQATWPRCTFLIHMSEAFDGWKAFVVRPPGDAVHVLVLEHPSPAVLHFVVQVVVFVEVVHRFAAWVDVEQQRADRQHREKKRLPLPVELLHTLNPLLHDGTFVFVSVPAATDLRGLDVIATMREQEGLSLVLPEAQAVARGWTILFRAAWLTLTVASELQAVGLTAVVSKALAEAGIATNVIAGAHHDHLFVPIEHATAALATLQKLQERAHDPRGDGPG